MGAVRRDLRRAVPTLMILRAVCPRFPSPASALWRHIEVVGPTLAIQFEDMRRTLAAPAADPLLRLAREVWDGRARTCVREVVMHSDLDALEQVLTALEALYQQGRGPEAEEFLRELERAVRTR